MIDKIYKKKVLVTLIEDTFPDHSGLKLLPLRSFDVHAESLLVNREYKLKDKKECNCF